MVKLTNYADVNNKVIRIIKIIFKTMISKKNV